MKVMGTVLWIAVACLLFLAAIFLMQDRLLYMPSKVEVQRMASGDLRAWPSAQDFRGLVAEPAGAVRGTAIVFHGNAGHAGHRAFYAHALMPLGLRVILAEYPGYGPRAGLLGETSLVADAEETVALAHRQYGAPLVLMGESLGAAVAAAAGARQPELTAGLLLMVAGLLAVASAAGSAPTPVLALLLAPIGSGGALAVPAATALLLEHVPAERAGTASGVLNTCRQLGAALAVAVFGALLANAGLVDGLRASLLLAALLLLVTAAASLTIRADQHLRPAS